jgi:hypothetical protein
MKVKLAQANTLNRFRFDMLNPGNVEEVILVIGDEEALHLCGRNSAIWLRYIDNRQIEIRKDIH